MTQKILGYFCDFNSMAAAHGADTSGATAVSSMTFTPELITSKIYVGGSRDYAQFTFDPVQQLTCKFKISGSGWNTRSRAYVKSGKSTAKIINFYNSAGVVLFSFGFKPAGNSTSTPATFTYTDEVTETYGKIDTDKFIGLFAYNDNTNVYTAVDYIKNVDIMRYYGGYIQPSDFNVSIRVALDSTTPANSTVSIYINGLLCCQLAAGVLGTNSASLLHNVAKVTVNEGAYSSSYNNNGLAISNFVLSTEYDDSLKAEVLPLSGFGGTNNFSGALSAITESKQDTVYLSTSAELAQKCQLLLSAATLPTIEQLDVFMFARYVQAGGVSCQFSVTLKNQAGAAIGASSVITITANMDELKYQTKLAASYISSLVSSNKLTAVELATAYIEIEIVGV